MNVTRSLVERQDHVTLTHKFMCECYTFDLCVFELKDPKYLKNETKLIVLALLVPRKMKIHV